MAKNFRPQSKNRNRAASPAFSNTRSLARPPEASELRARAVYGKVFIVLEDAAKNTFFYEGGAWVPYTDSIAECRRTGQVKELPQRLNQMIRYEVRRQAN